MLSGVSARASGQTIYDTAVATSPIDEATAQFDPVFTANSSWRKTQSVTGTSPIDRRQVSGNDVTANLSKTNRIGGVGEVEFGNEWNYGDLPPGQLNPVHTPGLSISYTQPLLAGAGRSVNEAPIVIARFELDRSYFQFKRGIQQLVSDVIQGYWSLVEARTQLWAREIQVQQAREALELEDARLRTGNSHAGDVAQARVTYANFQANLLIAQASVIQSEATLRNLLGLPPEDGRRLVPSTPPTRDRVQFDWAELMETAQLRRPDLTELHLILLADNQRLLQANNQSLPTLNAVAVQRWDGITGQMGNGASIGSALNSNPSWTLGVTFEVPLGLRAARANARSQELVVVRDRANIQQGLHATEHILATTIRSLDQFYGQYEAFRETRAAARQNVEVQSARRLANITIFLNVLQAITTWGDAVSSEASSLAQYNTTLAALELETGTILETHGIVFTEEKFAATGPLGKHFAPRCYPRSLRPHRESQRYEDSLEAAEEAFDLEDYPKRRKTRRIPRQPLPIKADAQQSRTPNAMRRRSLFRETSIEQLFH